MILTTPTPTPACLPNQEAVVTKAAIPNYPRWAAESGPITVKVQVTIEPDGSVSKAEIVQSSYVRALDRSVLDAVRASTFAPKIVNCQPFTGQYIFRADFRPR